MSQTGFVIRLFLLLSALWCGGFLAFAERVADTPPAPAPADGIAVLTGSAGRITAGLELLKQRPSAKMLITGVGDGTAREELAEAFPGESALFDCCIELDRQAKDTVGNAEQTALWVRRNKLGSVIVVTSASHMPRSIVEMRRHMDGIRLERLPTRAGEDNPQGWWQSIGALQRIIVEFNKYIFSLVRARLLDDIGDVSVR
ncbi:MAG: YdcF family protein [Minwuia sp.]|uniref:YdcF family protein n=1 Tax=Minwuia sp. TaxID=2493630 RepID=UPI003A8B50DC